MNTNNKMKSMTGFSAFSSTMLITLLNENKLKPFWKKKRANLTYALLIFFALLENRNQNSHAFGYVK